MVRQPGPQDRRHDDLVVDQPDLRFAQRRLDDTGRIGELLRYLIGRDLPDTLQVTAEAHRILLHRLIADLCDELVEDSVLFTQNMQGHR